MIWTQSIERITGICAPCRGHVARHSNLNMFAHNETLLERWTPSKRTEHFKVDFKVSKIWCSTGAFSEGLFWSYFQRFYSPEIFSYLGITDCKHQIVFCIVIGILGLYEQIAGNNWVNIHCDSSEFFSACFISIILQRWGFQSMTKLVLEMELE